PAEEIASSETTRPEVQIETNRQAEETLVATEKGLILEEFASEYERIARLAYSYWQERGCPEGSPEEDWLRAEQVSQLGKLAKQVGSETSSQKEQTLSQSA